MQSATYTVLRDANFELDAGSVRRFTVPMPASPAFNPATAMPILSFRLHPQSDRLKFIIILNDLQGDANVPADKIEFLYDFEGSVQRCMRSLHEVLDGQKFKPGSDNLIDFRVVVGEAIFSDVVLQHRLQG